MSSSYCQYTRRATWLLLLAALSCSGCITVRHTNDRPAAAEIAHQTDAYCKRCQQGQQQQPQLPPGPVPAGYRQGYPPPGYSQPYGYPPQRNSYAPQGHIQPVHQQWPRQGSDVGARVIQSQEEQLPQGRPEEEPYDPYRNLGPHPGLPAIPPSPPGPLPTEKAPASLPPYTVAPPDILLIDADRLIPRPPYRVQALEVLLLQVSETLPNQPILGKFVVSPEGSINLGFNYGIVRIGGLTVDQAQEAIRRHLSQILRSPQVSLSLESFRGVQQIRGEHLVRPDGTISLGTYGCVYVAGLTTGQIKCLLERFLANFVLDPQISVDVFAYNSKAIYVITDGAGRGQQVFKLPYTGNETVLDAIANVQGLPAVASKKHVWVARPGPANMKCSQILPVDWRAITEAGQTATNYQLFPGDRVYVKANPLDRFYTALDRVLAPVERIMGVILLGQSVASGGVSSGQ